MDHLPLPESAAHVDLSFFGTEEYDGGELLDYPRRKNWTEAELDGRNVSGRRTLEEVNTFFQTWLFFGCLTRVFRSLSIGVKSDDFIRTKEDGTKVITTKLLPDFMQQWRNGRRRGGTWESAENAQRAELDRILGRKTRNNVFSSPIESLLEDHRRCVWRCCGEGSLLSPEVAIAIVTLQWTLSYWAMGINHSGWTPQKLKAPERASTFLKERILEGGWCPSEAARFTNDMSIDGSYYFGFLKSPRYEDDHSRCTPDQQNCGYQTNDRKYMTRHTSDGCDCKFEKAPLNFLDIVKNGGTPIMSWSNGQLHAVKFDPAKMRYVAISHV
jgi:hypothetical protein